MSDRADLAFRMWQERRTVHDIMAATGLQFGDLQELIRYFKRCPTDERNRNYAQEKRRAMALKYRTHT